MSDFYDALEAALDASRKSDRALVCRPCIEAQFLSSTVRLWGGIGPLFTPDGERWAGWIGIPEGDKVQSFVKLPKLKDLSDGSSPLYEFALGYVDAETYSRVRDLDEEVKGRKLIVSSVYLPGNSTRAVTPPGDSWRLTMQQSRFRERRVRDTDGGFRELYSFSVLCKNANAGRSQIEFGLMNDAGQRARSKALYDVDNDAYAQFAIKYINGYTINLDA